MGECNQQTLVKLMSMEKFTKKAVKEKRKLCCNAELSVEEGTQDEKTGTYEWFTVNMGCENDRRNGSKYCHNCSDEHNKK